MRWLVRGLFQLPGTLYRYGPRAVYERLNRRVELLRSRETRFTCIAESGGFGSSPSLSGEGSSLEATEIIRNLLPQIIERYRVTSLLDIPCGDFYWMQHLDLNNVQYVGIDIVRSIVDTNNSRFRRGNMRFIVGDICNDVLPRADLAMSRDCMIHLKLREIQRALRNLKASGAGLLLLSTYPEEKVNAEIDPRFFRKINLEMPPFGLPKPLELFWESKSKCNGKALGLWRNSDLPGR